MATLAIKGHATRGEEVIEILEMLGGRNTNGYNGYTEPLYYYIDKDGSIECDADKEILFPCIYSTLEEFLEKFPYKVGDKVQHKGATSRGTVYVIERMKWANNHTEYEIRPLYDYNHTGLVTLCVEYLQPYKPTIEDTNKVVFECQAQCNNIRTEIINKQQTMEEERVYTKLDFNYEPAANKVELILGDYEIKEEYGKTYLVKKKLQYPTTYEECCKVLNIIPNNKLVFSNPNEESEYAYRNLALYNDLDKLKVCRDAYWVLADYWKPDWKDYTNKYCLFYYDSIAQCDIYTHKRHTLAFPTEEMRDAFYENFKDLIEECKELL